MLFAFLLAALTPSQQAIASLAEQDIRVATIGYRLARAGGCQDSAVSIPGLVIQDAAQYPAGARHDARIALKLGDGPTITGIVAGSVAAEGGLRPGDRIVGVNGTSIAKAATAYAATQQTEDLIEAGMAKGGAMLDVIREGERLRVRLASQPGCASRFQIVPVAAVNAQADGRYVQVFGGLIEFSRNDDELAVMIAHELAHNVLKHRVRLDNAGVSRGLFAGLGRGGRALRDAEYEADRLGVWLVARAGYSLDAVLPFWTRFGQKNGHGILSDGTHPRWKDRLARLSAAVADVRAQKAAGQALTYTAQQSSSQPEIRR